MKKIFLLILFLTVSFINIIPGHAMVGRMDRMDFIYKTQNTNGNTSYETNSTYELYVDDILTYCITPGIFFKQGDGYYEGSNPGLSSDLIHQMELISYYGYRYKNHTDINYYLASQEMIHDLLGYTTVYNYGNYDVNSYKEEISNLVSNHNILPTIDDDLYMLVGHEQTFVDMNGVLDQFEIQHSDNVQVDINGDEITIVFVSGEEGTIQFYKGVDKQTKYYLKDNSQTVVDFELSKELLKTVTIHSKGIGKIEVTDQERATCEPIAGTKYNLLDFSFQVLETKITDENGRILFDNDYEYGRYYVEEVEVLDYPRNEYIIVVDLESDLFTAPFFHGELGTLKINNIDEYGNPLNGKFKYYHPYYISNSFDDLITGTYIIRQTEVQDGYLIDNNEYEVTITKDNLHQELTIINYKALGSLVINNVDKNGNKLKGKFEVTNEDGEKVSLTKMNPGKYYVRQTSVQSGYIMDEEVREVDITLDNLNQEITIINDKKLGSLIINNIDESRNKLNGEFQVLNSEGEEVSLTDMEVGKYYVKQISSELGYMLDEKEYEVNITLKSLNKELTIINKKILGSLVINNIDCDGKKLTGKFEVTNEDGEKVSLTKMNPGKYYVRQTSVQSGYIMDEEVHEIDITLDNLNQEITIINDKKLGSLIINNIDESRNKLNGEFKVLNSEGEEVSLNDMEIGKYYVKQISSELGYTLDEKEYEVNITLKSLNKELTIINKKLLGSLVINNIDCDGKKLTGKFEVTNEDGEKVSLIKMNPGKYYVRQTSVQSRYIIDEELHEIDITFDNLNQELTIINDKRLGSLIISNLDEFGNKLNGEFQVLNSEGEEVSLNDMEIGKYYVKQISSELGYTLDEKEYEVNITLKSLNKELTIINKKLLGSLVINNIDCDGKKLTGKFEVTNEDGEKVSLTKMNPGKYYVRQTSVQSGYIIDEEVREVDITLDNLNQEITIINDKKLGSLIINNIDESRNKLNGEFQVLNSEGEEISLNDMEIGKYYVKQISSELGYTLDEKEYEVNITLKSLNKELTIVNKKILGSLVINNIDQNGKKLKGKFEITNENGEKVSLTKMNPGKYYVRQTSVQSGYIIDEEVHEIDITLDNLNQELNIVNAIYQETIPKTSSNNDFIFIILSLIFIVTGYKIKRINL